MYATDDAFTLMLSCSWCDGAIGRATDLQLTLQATYICVPLSPSSVIRYRPRGWSLWLGKYPWAAWKV